MQEVNVKAKKTLSAKTESSSSVWRWDCHEPGFTYRASASNGKIIVAAGDSGLLKTSSNGTTWIKQNSGQTRNLYAATYSPELNLFAVVGYHSIIITSSDGVNWIEASPYKPTALSFKGVAYGNGKFVAVGVQGIVKTSVDGAVWKDLTGKSLREMSAIHFANGLFVAAAVGNIIYSTKDGENWTAVNVPKFDPAGDNLYSVTFGNGTWVVGGAHGACYTSTNGTSWQKRDTNTTNYFMDLVYTGKEFVGVGDSNNYPDWGSMILTSPDGTVWKREKAPSKFNPGDKACYSTILTNVVLGDRVYGLGARGEVISKNVSSSSGGDVEKPTISITSPVGGEKWEAGIEYHINWVSTGKVNNIKLEYSVDNGQSWILFDANAKNDGNRPWLVPNTPSAQCKVKVSDVSNKNLNAVSNAFSITSPTTTVVINPGVNTISQTLKTIKQGDSITLMAGSYIQTEPFSLPPGVFSFSLIIKGTSPTKIEFGPK